MSKYKTFQIHDLKKSCVAGRAEESEMEAGPSKKRKVEGKGKGKAKVGTPVQHESWQIWNILINTLNIILNI